MKPALLALAGILAGTGDLPRTPPTRYTVSPPRKPSVALSVTTSLDRTTGLWTYSYRVRNQSEASAAVGAITLLGIAPICDLSAPAGWWGFPEWRGTDGVRWRSQPATDSRFSPHAVEPGSTLAGFAFRSHAPPGPVAFVCEADLPPTEHPDAEPAEDAFHDAGGYEREFHYENATTGFVPGPVGRGYSPCSSKRRLE